MALDIGVQSRPFNIVDQLIFHLDQAADPWSVQCEVRVRGRLDPDLVAAAARAAAARHPMARARMSSSPRWSRRYAWEIATDPLPVRVLEFDVPDDAALDEFRARAMSRGVDLQSGPPFELTLAHHPGGDRLMLNLHHVAGDGVSAYRLMTSIARSYAGHDDPTPALDELAARDLRAQIGTHSLRQARVRIRGLVERVRQFRSSGAPARVAVAGGTAGATGFRFHLLRLSRDEVRTAMSSKAPGATVNDLLLASLGLAIRRFNDDRGVRPARVSVMMPVNLRPTGRQHELVSNIVSFVPVIVPIAPTGDVRADLATAQHAVSEETRALKQDERAGTMIDLFGGFGFAPAQARHRLHRRLNARIEQVLDTAVLSNLGRLDAPLDFGAAGPATELWFSPPARMPLGTAIGVATVAEQMFLTIRYCRAQFDAAGAAAFASVWRDVLLCGSETPVSDATVTR